VLSQGNGKYSPGDTAELGSFGYQPVSGNAQRVESITVKVGRPGDFSSLTLTASIGKTEVGSVTVNSPDIAKETVFTFSPPLDVPANSSMTFALSGAISSGSSGWLNLSSRVRLAGIVGGGAGALNGAGPLVLALGMFGLVMAPFGGVRSRRRGAIIAAAILMLATGLAGCGGSSSGGQNPTASTQRVIAMAVTEGGSQISVSGLPLNLGTVSKK
jgi:hypothetical protein